MIRSNTLLWSRLLNTLRVGTVALPFLALSTLVAPSAQATPVVYQFAGVVDSDDAMRGWSHFSGSFTFSSTASDGIADAQTGAYAHAGSPWGLSLSFDDGPALNVGSLLDVLVSNDLGGADQWGILARTDDMTRSVSLTLWDFTGTVFASDALPLPADGLAWASFGWGQLSYESPEGWLQGVLTAMSCSSGCAADGPVPGPGPAPQPLPEPATFWLCAMALLALTQRSWSLQRSGPAQTERL